MSSSLRTPPDIYSPTVAVAVDGGDPTSVLGLDLAVLDSEILSAVPAVGANGAEDAESHSLWARWMREKASRYTSKHAQAHLKFHERRAARSPSASPSLSEDDTDTDSEGLIPSLTISEASTSPALSPASSLSDLLGATLKRLPVPSPDVEVQCMVRTRIPTPHGEVFLHLYHNTRDGKEHLAVVVDPAQLTGEPAPLGVPHIRSRSLDGAWNDGETAMDRITRGAYVGRLSESGGVPSAPQDTRPFDGTEATQARLEVPPPLVRIHSECFTGETIGSLRCDCGEQLDEALRRIAQPQSVVAHHADGTTTQTTIPGRGAVIYMRQEGRGIGLLSKLRAYNLQDLGHDTVTANLMLGHGADERGYEVAAAIMQDLGLGGEGEGVRLLTNNPDKVAALARAGVQIAERVPMVPRTWRCQAEDARSSVPVAHAHPHALSSGEVDADVDGHDRKHDHGDRLPGATLIGGGAAHGPELEKYLRTKILRMGHMLSLPSSEGVVVA